MTVVLVTGGGWQGEVVSHIIFLIEADEEGGRLILLPGLGFASIAFLPEGEIQIIAVETDPVTLASLCRTVVGAHCVWLDLLY